MSVVSWRWRTPMIDWSACRDPAVRRPISTRLGSARSDEDSVLHFAAGTGLRRLNEVPPSRGLDPATGAKPPVGGSQPAKIGFRHCRRLSKAAMAIRGSSTPHIVRSFGFWQLDRCRNARWLLLSACRAYPGRFPESSPACFCLSSALGTRKNLQIKLSRIFYLQGESS